MAHHFTSDQHFGHGGIIHKMRTQFADVPEMDFTLTHDWNKSVKPEDTVFVIGDFSFYKHNPTTSILSRLNGAKHLVLGNHDHGYKKGATTPKGWDSVQDLAFLKGLNDSNGEPWMFLMTHEPKLRWRQMQYGAYHLHGHCHGHLTYPEELKNSRIMDVGVDVAYSRFKQYRPFTLKEVVEELRGRFTRINHHTNKHQEVS